MFLFNMLLDKVLFSTDSVLVFIYFSHMYFHVYNPYNFVVLPDMLFLANVRVC